MTDEAAPAVTLTRMAMGSDVPEWLLTIEPDNPHARKGAVRFLVDVSVLDTPKCYFVIPDRYNGPCVDMSQVQRCRVFASSKEVRFAVNQEAFFTEDINAWHSSSDAARTPAPDFHQMEAQRQAALRQYQDQRPQVANGTGPPGAQFGPVHTVIDHTVQRPGLFRRWWLALFG